MRLVALAMQLEHAVDQVLDRAALLRDSGEVTQVLLAGREVLWQVRRAHATTKRVLRAWRSGGVAAADRVTHAEGPSVMLSQDLQDGIASLQRDGPGHATFNNR